MTATSPATVRHSTITANRVDFDSTLSRLGWMSTISAIRSGAYLDGRRGAAVVGVRARPAAIVGERRGSELMAMRAVSKTVNPGSNPGSPAPLKRPLSVRGVQSQGAPAESASMRGRQQVEELA